MKYTKITLLLLLVSAVSCVDDISCDLDNFLAPTLSGVNATSSKSEIGITMSSAVSKVSLVKNGGFRWGMSQQALDNDLTASTTGKGISAKLDTKAYGKTLYFQPYVSNGANEVTGKTESFKVPGFDEYVKVSEPSFSITQDGTVKVTASLTVATGVSITEKGIRYGESENQLTNEIKLMADKSDFKEVLISGLEVGKTYFFYCYAKEGENESVSKIVPVVPCGKPAIITAEVINITSTGATVCGNVTDDGCAEVTERGIVWSESANPTIENGTKVTEGKGKGIFNIELTGLTPTTKYYVKAYATNKTGTVYGEEESFTTLVQKVTGVTISPSTLVMVTGETFNLVAAVAPTNATDKAIKWKSDNASVVSTDQTGKLTAYATGYANITVTTSDGGYTAHCAVTVEAANLSKSGTANCYIVSQAGEYKFNATVKGNSTTPIGGTPSTAEVLWESYGTDVTPTVGSVVKDVSYKDGMVSFSTPSTLNDGNAVIAVKNASGTILWSWHIWVCRDFDPEKNAQKYNNGAGIMMDRNLGATSVTKGDVRALGLMYQWGRKDPFLSGGTISGSAQANSTLSWPSSVTTDINFGTIDYAIKNPTTFIDCSNNDWLCTISGPSDNTRWQSTKTMYDPCPAGWRVPDGGSSGVWSKAFGTSTSWSTSSNWDSTNKGIDFGMTDKALGTGTIWYPAAGYRRGLLYNIGNCSYYWSCTPFSINMCIFGFNYQYLIYPQTYETHRATGYSVRCLQE